MTLPSIDRLKLLQKITGTYREGLADYITENHLDNLFNMALNPTIARVILANQEAEQTVRDLAHYYQKEQP